MRDAQAVAERKPTILCEWLRRFAGMLAVILFAFGIFLPWAAFSDGPTDAPVALGSNATGADLKEKMQKTWISLRALTGWPQLGFIT